MNKRKICIFILSFILSLKLIFPQCVIADTYNESLQQHAMSDMSDSLYSKAAVLMDADTGRVLFEKNGDSLLPMASTTKIMTAIIAIENNSMDDIFSVSSYAASMPKVHMGVFEGQKFYMKDLLLGMMLESYNDAAVIIAEGVAGSVENFAVLMNEKAHEIGALHTNFVTPNGLDADGHQTTARDLALIMSYCINNDIFLEITRTQSHFFYDIDGKHCYSAVNHNSFLNSFDGSLSGKTGYTGNAGYCYVGAAQRGDKTFTIALLACGWPNNKTWKWSDARSLFEYGFGYYNKEEIMIPEITLPNACVKGGVRGSVELEISMDEKKSLLLSENDNINISYCIERFLTAPVEEFQYVGKIYIYINDFKIGEYEIRTCESDKRADYMFFFCKLIKMINI